MPAHPYYTEENLNSSQSIGYLVRCLHSQIVSRAEKQFVQAEITFSQWVTLKGLDEGIAKTCAEVAQYLGHDSGATTRMLDQLEQRGFIRRVRSKTDRRVVNIIMTPQGHAMVKSLTILVVGLWNEFLSDFPASDVNKLIQLSTRLLRDIERVPL